LAAGATVRANSDYRCQRGERGSASFCLERLSCARNGPHQRISNLKKFRAIAKRKAAGQESTISVTLMVCVKKIFFALTFR
ncbi:hypothetical protein, partial [Selenomonas sp. GACV-9]|uniref:hypothetical protein n=1 Tax=Selenomonas sp. GACV-9 TaxID=3158782 RepID=UPI001C43364B